MRLQRLEISGFKSFSDRSELSFDQGVTAIVGPNGCGKSNVADAITWVLGEQSPRSLRGERMEDVIFNGSDARKPTGAAEVRLRLSGVTMTPAVFRAARKGGSVIADRANGQANGNRHHHGNGHAIDADGAGDRIHDTAMTGVALPAVNLLLEAGEDELIDAIVREVEVTRRLYRSGDSEYLIDGEICRLRDVHDLLMDTGLGAKAYAIIEQGKIGMILSSRPADRRQLIEEAAGITKYKARRREAELKLDAARQNLTRIDDVIFEIEKQRGSLKRQAAKARRYERLRVELRRREKLVFTKRARELTVVIETAYAELEAARQRETAAAGSVAAVDAVVSRLRLELAGAEGRATEARESAHQAELALSRRQAQIEFNRQQAAELETRASQFALELEGLRARREPGRLLLDEKRATAIHVGESRDHAAVVLLGHADAHAAAHQEIEGHEGDVEAARAEVFATMNAATALGHAVEHARLAAERVATDLARLDIEETDHRGERDWAKAARTAAVEGHRAAQEQLDIACATRAHEEEGLAAARATYEMRTRELHSREHEIAGLAARLSSLEEFQSGRAAYGDAARTVLAQSDPAIGQLGAVADFVEVDREYERAVEGCLGELLQHVIVPSHEHAVAGLRLAREQSGGRCGFLVPDRSGTQAIPEPAPVPTPEGAVSLKSVVRVSGPYASTIWNAIGDAWIAPDLPSAVALARSGSAGVPVAARDGEVCRGPYLLSGGERSETRGILATKADVRDLRERIATEHDQLAVLAELLAGLEASITAASTRVGSLTIQQHEHEKALVGFDLQIAQAVEEGERLDRKRDLLASERRGAQQEGLDLEARQQEARAAIARLEDEQKLRDERMNAAQRRLFEARERLEGLGQEMATSRATHAGLVERASALAAEVGRLEEASLELDQRVAAQVVEIEKTQARSLEIEHGLVEATRRYDTEVRDLDGLRGQVQEADRAALSLRLDAESGEARLRELRRALEAVRTEVGELGVARATAESDLAHLASVCADTVQEPLDQVLAAVEQAERDGTLAAEEWTVTDDGEEAAEETAGSDTRTADLGGTPVPDRTTVRPEPQTPPLTLEAAIAALRTKIDRLGPVNMMAIEQFDELETRHGFLTSQRQDLLESIASTGAAIKRIDQTSKERFREAFEAINANFQDTFRTLFGGGHAGLTLLDENDVLESGIEIIASPPGKRLQSVQLLSGGEKALTAIALMFGIFKYKPSPFCLLDEIDAPLDDANIGRFVEMLRSMLAHTQFILITHNRKTMEIADRLYGVTMEEPGVSKLISVKLN